MSHLLVEPWEVELRKTLKGLNKPVVVNQIPKNIIKSNKKENMEFYFLFSFVIAFMLGLFLMYKNLDSIVKIKDYIFAPSISKNEPYEKDNSNLETAINNLNEKTDKIGESLEVIKNRILLLGALHNENWSILKNNKLKSDLIFFNRDWSIDKMPKHITIDEEEKKYLEKNLKD